jgi:hypothetical protein
MYPIHVPGALRPLPRPEAAGDDTRGLCPGNHIFNGFKPDSRGAYISPDGRYRFFSVEGDIWWVSSKVIEELRPQEAAQGALR